MITCNPSLKLVMPSNDLSGRLVFCLFWASRILNENSFMSNVLSYCTFDFVMK